MNKNIIIVLVGAVLVAVLVAMLVQLTLGKQEKPQVVAEAKVEVLVAAKDLGIGKELKAGDLSWQEWPKSSVFPGAVIRKENKKPEAALEGRLARNIGKGEPVMKSAMLGTAVGNMVSASLEPGQRAVAIEVDASSMAGGFIGPGDFVDIILTYRESVKADGETNAKVKEMLELTLDKMATETLLQNVKILAVDQMAERPEDNKVKVAKTVTVAVSMQDAERLFLASELGNLTLALRGVGDEDTTKPSWPIMSDARLTNMNNEIFKQYKQLKKDTSVNPNIVRIYNGESVVTQPAR